MINASQDRIADASWTIASPWRFPLALALLILLLAAGGTPWTEALRYERLAIAQGEWWRLLTGHFVHLQGPLFTWAGISFHLPWHAFLNVLALLAWALLCPLPWGWREATLCTVFLCLATSAGLYWAAPEVSWYVGFSGVLHGLFVLGLLPQVRRGDLVSTGCLLYLVGKLAYEWRTGTPVSDEQALGGRVVLAAHLWGVLAALAYLVLKAACLRGSRLFAHPNG